MRNLIKGRNSKDLYEAEVPIHDGAAGRIIGAGGAVRLQLELTINSKMRYHNGIMTVCGHELENVYDGVIALHNMCKALHGWSKQPNFIIFQPVESMENIIPAKHDVKKLHGVPTLLRMKTMEVQILGDTMQATEGAATEIAILGSTPGGTPIFFSDAKLAATKVRMEDEEPQ